MRAILGAVAWLAVDADGPPPTQDTYAECDLEIQRGVTEQSCRCYYVAARRGGDYLRATASLEPIVLANPEDPWPAYILADLYSDLADDRAVALYRRAAAGFSARGDANEGWVRLSLADALAAGDPRAAGVELELARGAAERGADEMLQATVIAELARHSARNDGDLTSALVALDEAERRLGDIPAYQPRQVIAHVRAGVLLGLDRAEEALAVRRAMAEAAAAVGDVYVETSSLAAMAQIASGVVGATDRATDYAERALALATQHDNPYMQAHVHCLLGNLDRPDVDAHYRRCREGAGGDHELEASAEVGLAWRALASDPRGARAGLTRALALMVGSGSALEVAHERIAIAWRLDPPEDALAESMTVLDDIDAAIARQRHAVGRAHVLDGWSAVHRFVAHQIIAGAGARPVTATIDASLAVSERWRGRVLAEQLDGDGVLALAGDEPRHVEHRAALDRYEAAHAALLDAQGGRDEAALREAVAEAEAAVTAAWDAVLTREPSAGLTRPAAPTLARIRAALAADEALLSIQAADVLDVPGLADLRIPAWAWLVTRDDAVAIALPDAEELRALVAVYIGALERGDDTDARPASGLYRRVLAPIVAELPPAITVLSVIADGELAGLPIATLRAAPDAAPFGERVGIAVAPSIALWLRVRERASPSMSETWVFADPEPPPCGAPGLPHARVEAQAIRDHLGDAVRVVVGRGVTHAGVSDAAPRARVLHIATHATTDLTHVGRQALALAADGDDDGWLHPREISSLELDGALVVVASCRSAVGPTTAGEGSMGLARAFLVAGARTVVATQWPVHDDDAMRFVDRFYAALATGETVAGAIGRAQQDLRARGLRPAVWAAFTAIGDGAWRPVPAVRRAAWDWLALGLLGGLGCVAVWLTRR